jgi:hypothetical protein
MGTAKGRTAIPQCLTYWPFSDLTNILGSQNSSVIIVTGYRLDGQGYFPPLVSICPSVCPSIHWSVCLSACLSVCLSISVDPTWSTGHPWNASLHFSFLILYSWEDSLDGGSARCKTATDYMQTNIHASSGIRAHDPSVWRHFMPLTAWPLWLAAVDVLYRKCTEVLFIPI